MKKKQEAKPNKVIAKLMHGIHARAIAEQDSIEQPVYKDNKEFINAFSKAGKLFSKAVLMRVDKEMKFVSKDERKDPL